MKKITTLIILTSTMIFFGCDPEFRHEFKGKVLNKDDNKPLERVKLEFTVFPIEKFRYWCSDVIEKDSLKFTDKNGRFEINFSTMSIAFDSLKIILKKEGFEDNILVSKGEEWKSGIAGFNLKRIRFDFGKVYLKRNEN